MSRRNRLFFILLAFQDAITAPRQKIFLQYICFNLPPPEGVYELSRDSHRCTEDACKHCYSNLIIPCCAFTLSGEDSTKPPPGEADMNLSTG